MPRSCLWSLAVAVLLCSAGCGGDGDERERVDEPAAVVDWPLVGCDPLVPSYCGFPFPSNVHTVEDDATSTGRRVRWLPGVWPETAGGATTDPAPFERADGFSPTSALLVELPGATLAGVPREDDIGASLEPGAATVILDAETLERVPHFTELDVSDPAAVARTMMIRPMVRLRSGRRYIVAIRNVVGVDGAALPPSPAFEALRDRYRSEEPSVEARRPLYADIFQRLAEAGVERSSLQLAWDFTTTSDDYLTRDLIHMREEALGQLGEASPPFEITEIRTDFQPDRYQYLVRGTFEAPNYLTVPEPGGALVYGDDGLPQPNPEEPTYRVPFRLIIPQGVTEESPAPLMQYGHGLLYTAEEIELGNLRDLVDGYDYAIFGVDLEGMNTDDGLWIAGRVSSGEIDTLAPMFDRLHQGMLNHILAMRMMARGMTSDPQLGPLLDGDRRYYYGISQGGNFGPAYMAHSPDVQRGVLEVMGAPYNLMLNRSKGFDLFNSLMSLTFPDARDRQFLLGNIQVLWDRTEPTGSMLHILEDRFEGIGDKQVLIRSAIGDHQVPNVASHVVARSMGLPQLETGTRPIYGLETVAVVDGGSAYVESEFGLPPVPLCNIPMDGCKDPHGTLRTLDASREQLDVFFRTGVIENTCPEGQCVFDGECPAGATAPVCPP